MTAVSPAELAAAVEARADEILGQLDTMTMKQLRATLEADLSLPPGALKIQKEAVKAAVDDLIKARAVGKEENKKAEDGGGPATPSSSGDDDDDSDDDADGATPSASDDGSTPPRKRKAPPSKAKPAAKKKTAPAPAPAAQKKKHSAAVERLKAVARAATIPIPPAVYIKGKDSEEVLEEELEALLAKHGLSGGSGEGAIKAAKKKLTLSRELDGIDTSNIIEKSEDGGCSGGGRGGRGARPGRAAAARVDYKAALAAPRLPGDSEDETDDDEDDDESSSSSSSDDDDEGGGGKKKKQASGGKKKAPVARAAATPSDDDDSGSDGAPSSSDEEDDDDDEPEASSGSDDSDAAKKKKGSKPASTKKAVVSDDECAARGGGPDAPPPTAAPTSGLVLPAWALEGGAGVPVSDPATYLSQYAASSDPLILQDGRDSGRRVPLFGAVHVRGNAPSGGSGGSASTAAAPPAPTIEAGVASDVVCFAGGPVWAMDWCPQAVREGDRVSRFLAVGVSISGPALIQVWRLPVGGSAAVKPAPVRGGAPPCPPILTGPAALPRPALALAHGGGLAWDCKWRPTVRGLVSSGNSAPLTPPLLGVLAAALGDGSLVVWAVPVPSSATKNMPDATAGVVGSKRKGPAGSSAHPSPARTPPILRLPPACLGACGLPASLEWCPSPPHDLLAAACWDGSAVLWRVGEWEEAGGAPPVGAAPAWPWGEAGSSAQPTSPPPPSSFGLSPLLRVQAEASPLRSIAWPPPPIRTAYPGSPPLTPFATVGHAADLCLWEGGSPASPRLTIALPREWALSLAWLPHPLGMLVAQDGGRLTFAPLDAGAAASTQAFPLDGHGEAWSVHATSPGGGGSPGGCCAVAAYGVGSGDVGVFEVRASAKGRINTGHRVVAGFRRRPVVAAAPRAAAAAVTPGGGGGRGRGRGRGLGGRGAAAAPPPPVPGLVLPTTDRTLILASAADLAKDACIYRGSSSSPATAKAAAARSALPDEGVAVTRVRWADGIGGVSGSEWGWLASAGGGGVVRLQLVDVRGCGLV